LDACRRAGINQDLNKSLLTWRTFNQNVLFENVSSNQERLETFLVGFSSEVKNVLAMNEIRTLRSSVRFGTFEVDLESHELRKQGMRVRLEEKPFLILALLLERAGGVVTRKTLREKLWPDTHVHFDQNLNTAVNKLRDLLGDSAHSPRFIETLPRLGYRFIAPVVPPERSSSVPGKIMLAVLPIENLGADREQEFFSDGLTEELISQLGQLNPKRLGVIARTSAIHYKRSKKSIAEIAAELGVEYVLEGSVRREGPRVRVTLQLIEARDQTHLWSANYDRDLRDVLAVHADVAHQVGKALAFELLPHDQSAAPAFDASAHEAYLRGRFYFGQRTEEALKKAVASFETALSIEPRCARSYSGTADCYGLLCWFGVLAPKEAGPKAAAAAARAIQFDPSLSEPHASMALVKFWYEWDWEAAEKEFLRAIELNPSYSSAYQWYGSYLNAMGRFDEAAAAQRHARELDPFSLILNMNAADPFFYGRKYEKAVRHLQALLEQEPRFFPALFQLGRAYVQVEMYDEAIAAFEKAVQFSGNREGLPSLAHAYALAGRAPEARQILDEMKNDRSGRYVASPMIARIYLGLGHNEAALDWLEKGLEERSYWNILHRVDPVYDPIRLHPRFIHLLEQLDLAS
jgi:TolB-like protein/Flp pilus assembly protein TadD